MEVNLKVIAPELKRRSSDEFGALYCPWNFAPSGHLRQGRRHGRTSARLALSLTQPWPAVKRGVFAKMRSGCRRGKCRSLIKSSLLRKTDMPRGSVREPKNAGRSRLGLR